MRHDDVGDQHVDGTGVRSGHFQSLDSVGGLQHAVSGTYQEVAHQFADALLVFDEQNRFRPSRASPLLCVGRENVELGGDLRQVNLERGSATDFAVNVKIPAALLHPAVHGRK